MTKIGAANLELVDITKLFVAPLFTLQRMTQNFITPTYISIEVDSDDIKEKYDGVMTKIQGFDFGADFLLEHFYNIYRRMQFPKSPELIKGGVTVLKDHKSLLIQAADVIGNFALSYIYYRLGNTSKKRIIKGQIFEEIFGDRFAAVDIVKDIELLGDNDLKLKFDGAFTLQLGHYE